MKSEVLSALESLFFYEQDSRYVYRTEEMIAIQPFDMANFRTRETNGDGPTAYIVAAEYQKIGQKLIYCAEEYFIQNQFSRSTIRVQKEILELAADAMRQACVALLYAEQKGEKE